LDQCNQDVIK